MQLLLSQELSVPGARRLSPDELRLHREERFAWAVGRGHSVVALACELVGLAQAEQRSPGLAPRALGALARTLEAVFQASEAVVSREGSGLVVLLVGPDPQRLEAACREWAAGAKELAIDGPGTALGPSLGPGLGLRLGYAVTQPGKRLFLDTLFQVAREGLQVARCRGAGACVHTVLYDILQRRLERERGTEGLEVTASAPLSPGTEGVDAAPPAARPPIRPASAPAPVPGSSLGSVPSSGRGIEAPLAPSSTPAPAPSSRTGASSGAVPAPEALPVSEVGPVPADRPGEVQRRERELALALEAQRRENEALRARLEALQAGNDPGGVLREREPLPAAPVADEDGSRIDLLERRLAKLRRSLEEAEERLARATEASSAEPGLPSRYRQVQGLDSDSPQRALKASLMREIFEANLDLFARLRAWPPAPPTGATGGLGSG